MELRPQSLNDLTDILNPKKESSSMSMLSAVSRNSVAKPRRLGIYGGSGVGKTTFASQFPNPILIDVEGGADDLDVAKTPRCTRLETVTQVLLELSDPNIEHGFETVIVDSMDWYENLIMRDMHDRNFNTDYGRGAIEEARLFSNLIKQLDLCRDRGMSVVMIAHSSIRSIQDTNGNTFTRTEPKLSKRNTALWLEYCDEVGLARQKVFFSEANGGFDKNRKIARTVGEVELVFAPNPQHASKKRLAGLPDQVNLHNFGDYAQYVPYLQGQQPLTENKGTV